QSERNPSWDNWKKHKLGRNPVFAARYEALQKTHQEMMDSVKEEAVRDLFSLKNLIHRLHISEPAQHVMSLLGRRYPTDLPSFSRSRLPGPWDPALAGTRMQLPVPQTWDRELSYRGNKAAVWEELIAYKVILDLEKKFKEKDEPFPSNRHFVEKITRLLKLPMNFERRRYVRNCMEIPLIFQMVKKEKKKLLKSRTLILISNCYQLGKSCVQGKNMYCPTFDRNSCNDQKNPMTAKVFLCNFSDVVGAIPMTGSVLKDVQTLQNMYNTVYYSDDWSPSDIIKDFFTRREHVDNILLLSSDVEKLDGSCLQLYRQHVAPDCLFINICAEPGFMSECGNSRFLEHVDKVDEIHGLPKQQRTATAQQEPGAVWRSVRIFISSTFRDMHGERDLLIRSVFPELRARAARFCLAIQEIDLRWGITEQESQRNKWNCVKTYPSGRSITELEAVQFLNGSHDPTAESRAFFYLREPDFLGTVPEAWKKDFGAESEEAAQLMADLKGRLRKHGSLAAFSSESELTTDSKEEEGHALQESFQESQQRRFCARMKLLNTTVAQMRGGKLYVVSGEPGQGKTVFLAALAEKLRKMVLLEGEGPSPKYHVVAHFTKAGPNQTKAQFECLLHAVAKLLKRRQSLVLLIDGADLIHTAGGELVSDWLPENVPQQVSLVLSISEESTLLKSLKQRKDTTFIPLQPLSPPDRAVIVRKDLAQHGKKLEECSSCSSNLSERIQKLPISLPLMMQHLLGCLEQDHGLELVTITLVSLWASRDGLMEQDLYSVLAMWKKLNGTTVTLEKAINAGRHVGSFPTALFFDLLRSLRGLLGACGSPSELPGSRLQLCGAPLRMAVERRYLKKPGKEHTAHVFLAAHWWKLLDPDGSRTFQKSEAEALTAVPFHLVISAHLHLGLLRNLSEAYALYATAAGSEPNEAVNLFSDFLQRNVLLLSQNPLLLLQQAANEPSSSDLCLQAEAALWKCGKPFLKWINKPERAQQTRSHCWYCGGDITPGGDEDWTGTEIIVDLL
ncbi:hypothetical protein E2320_003411, partial [Naja naja]